MLLILGFFFSFKAFALEEIIGKSFVMKNLKGTKIQNTIFVDCEFNYANFENSEIKDVKFINSRLLNTKFSGSTLTNVSFIRSDLGGSNFKSAKINNLIIQKSRAPKLSFWKANATNLTFENSYLLSLDMSETEIQALKINNSIIDDSVFFFKKPSTVTLLNTNITKIRYSQQAKFLQNSKDAASNFAFNVSDIKILKHPEISVECQKNYPFLKNNRPFNSPIFMTDGETGGFGFTPCLNKMQFEVALDYSEWPKQVRNSLVLEVVTNISGNKIRSDLQAYSNNRSIFLDFNKSSNRFIFHLSSETNFTIYEIKLVTRSVIDEKK